MIFNTTIRLISILILLSSLYVNTWANQADTLGNYKVKWNKLADTVLMENGTEHVLNGFEQVIYHDGIPFYRLLLPDIQVVQATVINPFYSPLVRSISALTSQPELEKTLPLQVRLNPSKNATLLDVPVLYFDNTLEMWMQLDKFDLVIRKKSADKTQKTAARVTEEMSSVLAVGDWYKIAVVEEGVYKLDYNFFRDIGISPEQIDPALIRLYGNGGKMLPQANATQRPADLTENAIWLSGTADGKFDREDFLLFYGQSSDDLFYDTRQEEWIWQNNDYSDTTFYFLTIDDDPGKRISLQSQPSGNFPTYDYADMAWVHEKDLYNLLEEDLITNAGSGREWLGERLGSVNSMISLTHEAENIVTTYPLTLQVTLTASAYQTSDVNIRLSGNDLGTISLEGISEARYGVKGRVVEKQFLVDAPPENNPQIQIRYVNPSLADSRVYLNNIKLFYRQKLILGESQLKFRILASTGQTRSSYRLTSPGVIPRIWDVTNPLEPSLMQAVSDGDFVTFHAHSDTLRSFIAFTDQSLLRPQSVRKVANQNLREDLSPEMVIVAHPDFRQAAQNLAAFRQSNDQIPVKVVQPEAVFNEFSGGSPDVSAIRDYMKHLYDYGNLRYLLLMGKSSFDYKNILAEKPVEYHPNFVLTYQSRNHLHPIFSYSSDDFFGFLDDHEGEWIESSSGDHLLDIGVGRIPATSADEANTFVEKMISYEKNKKSYGTWRKKVQFVADDEDGNIHQKDADILAEFLNEQYNDFDVNKIYLDAYPQETTVFGERVPGVNKALKEAIEQGSLVINFTGHGRFDKLTDENILDKLSIEELENPDNLPLFVTATCEFGRHDHPGIRSGAEDLLFKSDGGAVGLVTTARPVFSNTNFLLNRAFYQTVFEPVEGILPRLGDVFAATKNNSLNGSINRNFSLLGDPSMKLAYPDNQIANVQVFSLKDQSDTLRALDLLQIAGNIRGADGTIQDQFNGKVYATVFDKPRSVTTFGDNSPVMTFKQRDNLLFKGEATVQNGHFTLQFPVPRNINYQAGEGKISLYAHDSGRELDATGSVVAVVGGSVVSSLVDKDPPEIWLYLNDTLFADGDVTNPEPYLLARLQDESGISISQSGIGQNITVTVDENEPQIVNRFYSASTDTYQSGWLRYPLQEMEEGEHKLQIKVWDIFNNSATAELNFWVGNVQKLILTELKNFPNPFTEKTTITTGHNKSGEPIDVHLQIFSSQGDKVLDQQLQYSEATSRISLEWEGYEINGNKLPPGIYILRMTVRSVLDGASGVASTKLIIAN